MLPIFIVMTKTVNACWGDPDEIYYTQEGSDKMHCLTYETNGFVFGIWNDFLAYDKDDYEIGTLMHDEFLMFYLYYYGWPPMDIIPSREIDDEAWDYDVACNVPVQYDNYMYLDDDDNVLPEYQMTYGHLVKMLGSPSARGRVMIDYNNNWEKFIAFWDEPTLNELSKIYKAFGGDAYIVTMPYEIEAKEYFATHEVPTLKDYINGNTDIPKITTDQNRFALHLQKAGDKWKNTADFRAEKSKKIANKLGSMTPAQYHSLIYQEQKSEMDKLISESIRKALNQLDLRKTKKSNR